MFPATVAMHPGLSFGCSLRGRLLFLFQFSRLSLARDTLDLTSTCNNYCNYNEAAQVTTYGLTLEYWKYTFRDGKSGTFSLFSLSRSSLPRV